MHLPLVLDLTWRALCQQPSQVMLQDKQRDGKRKEITHTHTMHSKWWKESEILLFHNLKQHDGFPGHSQFLPQNPSRGLGT